MLDTSTHPAKQAGAALRSALDRGNTPAGAFAKLVAATAVSQPQQTIAAE